MLGRSLHVMHSQIVGSAQNLVSPVISSLGIGTCPLLLYHRIIPSCSGISNVTNGVGIFKFQVAVMNHPLFEAFN